MSFRVEFGKLAVENKALNLGQVRSEDDLTFSTFNI